MATAGLDHSIAMLSCVFFEIDHQYIHTNLEAHRAEVVLRSANWYHIAERFTQAGRHRTKGDDPIHKRRSVCMRKSPKTRQDRKTALQGKTGQVLSRIKSRRENRQIRITSVTAGKAARVQLLKRRDQLQNGEWSMCKTLRTNQPTRKIRRGVGRENRK